MKLVTLPLSLCIFLLYGCLDAAETETQSHETNKYTISLQGGKLVIDDHPLSLPLPIDKVIQKIGVYTRFAAKGNDIYTWDQQGFKLWSRPNKKNIYQIGVYIRKKKPVEEDSFSPTGRRFIDSRPKQDFSGTFILDGVKITRKITFETLNAKKTGKKFNRTHWASQFQYRGKHKDTSQSYQVYVYLRDDRTIRLIEINYDLDS